MIQFKPTVAEPNIKVICYKTITFSKIQQKKITKLFFKFPHAILRIDENFAESFESFQLFFSHSLVCFLFGEKVYMVSRTNSMALATDNLSNIFQLKKNKNNENENKCGPQQTYKDRI